MDVININHHRKIWRTDAAGCAACGHQWQSVYPIGAEDVGLECPSCGSGLGSVLPEWAMFDTETSRVAKLLSDQNAMIVRLSQQYADLLTEMERIADLSERWEDSLVSQINEIARAAIAKATGGK